MIGWKCSLGYVSKSISEVQLSDINIVETNRYWMFPVCNNPQKFNITRAKYDEVWDKLESMLGSDIYLFSSYKNLTMDPPDLNTRNLAWTYVTRFPSVNKTFPTNQNFKNSEVDLCIVFNTLSRCIIFRNGNNPFIFEINGNNLNFLSSGNYFTWQWARCFAYLGGPLSDYHNWYYIVTERVSFNSPAFPNEDWSLKSSEVSFIGREVFFKNLFGDSSEPDISGPNVPPDNPYEPGGPSGPTDPELPPGTFDDESDTIPDSSLPTISAANTGFTRIYNPSLSQVQALARYLWTDDSVIETIWNHIKQFFENPMEAIIGFNLVPVPVPDGGTENFALMYIDTGVSMTVAANQFVDMDCGTLELKRYYGSALDQSPYTKVSCFLPYIGTVNLNTDEVMGTTLQVKYRVDIVSGSCVAKIFVDGNCLYQYSGHCAITIPISSADFSSYVSAAISVGKLAASAITAGAGVAMANGVADVSQQTNQVVTTTQVTNTARNPTTGRQITTGTTTTVQTRESPADQSSTQASFSGLAPQNVANTVGAIMSSKPHIEHSGSFSGNSGYLGVRRPFLIIERPNMCMPANYQALNGFPSMITMELSTCKGFTRVQQVQLTGMGRATNPEQAEIMELLKSGVIL